MSPFRRRPPPSLPVHSAVYRDGNGTANTGVTWTATSGTVSDTGLFTAPQVQNNTTVTVTATSVADTSANASDSNCDSACWSTSDGFAELYVRGAQRTSSVHRNCDGNLNTKVTWKAVSGTITQAGLYTAPSKTGSDTVTATSQADTTKSETSSVTITRDLRRRRRVRTIAIAKLPTRCRISRGTARPDHSRPASTPEVTRLLHPERRLISPKARRSNLQSMRQRAATPCCSIQRAIGRW